MRTPKSRAWLPAIALLVTGTQLFAAGRMAITEQAPDSAAAALDTLGLSARLHPHITIGGVALAAIFAGAVITILSWLLAVPPQMPAIVAHARRIVSAIRKIVVPVNMHTNWERAVELACRLGQEQKAEILLTYVMEVPFTLSLDAPMGRAETTAREVLDRAVSIVQQHELSVRTQIERARQAGEGIARLARDEDADLIVVGTPKLGAHLPGFQTRTIEILLRRAPCEVIIDAAPGKTEEVEPELDRPSGPGA